MMTAWCLGIVFGQDLTEVLLLRKGRTLHVGLWNGIGGKIERQETPAESMHRECEEETDLKVYPPFWEPVGTIGFPNGNRVHVFTAWIADLSDKFQLAADDLVIADWPTDKPLRVPRNLLSRFELAPHTEIMIYAGALKLQNPRRDQVHIQEVGRF